MQQPILETRDLKVHFTLKASDSKKLIAPKRIIKAVDGIDLAIAPAEVLSLVGESGSGKTTTGKAMLQLVPNVQGEVCFEGKPVVPSDKAGLRAFRQRAQMIYQDPYQSLNPRDVILDIVAEPLDVNRLMRSEAERRDRVCAALEAAGMTPAVDYLYRYPYELSGGQRQRVVIAGAMIMQPAFVVADEPVSMLDASIRTGILKLMLGLREQHELAYLFITHDLSLAWLISDRIAIMYLGRIVEIGPADVIIHHGLHPYAKALVSIMPVAGKGRSDQRQLLVGETPSATDIIKGCDFHTRCPQAAPICLEQDVRLREVEPGHSVACHLYQL